MASGVRGVSNYAPVVLWLILEERGLRLSATVNESEVSP